VKRGFVGERGMEGDRETTTLWRFSDSVWRFCVGRGEDAGTERESMEKIWRLQACEDRRK